VRFALVKIEKDLKSGTLILPSTIGASTPFNHTAPDGFSFVLSQITNSGSNIYTLPVPETVPAMPRA